MGAMLLRRLAIGVLAAALCFGAAAQQAQNGELVNNHEIALRLQAEKKWDELLRHLEMWEEEGGQDPIIFRMRTEALRETGDLAGAIETMRDLQKETPESQRARHAEILRALGELQTEEGDFESAEKSFRRALAISEVALTWRQLAELLTAAYLTSKLVDEVVEDEVVRILPPGVSTGVAQEAVKEAIDEIRSEKGLSVGRSEDAEIAWRKTLSYGQYINDAELWGTYAFFRLTLDDSEKAYKALEHVVRLTPGDAVAWRLLFVLADELGKKKAQRVIVARLERIDANDPFANVYLGMDAQKRGDRRMANYHYDIAVQETPDDGHLFDKWQEQLPPTVHKLIVSDGQSFAKWRALAFFGLARNAEGREKALENYRNALLADPTLFTAWESAIVTLRRMRRFKDARIYSEKFVTVKQYVAEGRSVPDNLLTGI